VNIDRFSPVDLLAPPVSNITDRDRERNGQSCPEDLRKFYTGVEMSWNSSVIIVTRSHEQKSRFYSRHV